MGLSNSKNFLSVFKATVDKERNMIKDKLVGHIEAEDLEWVPLMLMTC